MRATQRALRNAWAERYMITSVKGRVYTRTMLRVLVMRAVKLYAHERHASFVDVVLDDDAYMRRHRGRTPSGLACEIEREAWSRWYDAGNR